MTDPLTTLIRLTDDISHLDHVQDLVFLARLESQTDQETQLKLDRQQTEIDRKRMLLEIIMADIRNRN